MDGFREGRNPLTGGYYLIWLFSAFPVSARTWGGFRVGGSVGVMHRPETPNPGLLSDIASSLTAPPYRGLLSDMVQSHLDLLRRYHVALLIPSETHG